MYVQDLKEAFKMFDRNKDGYIDLNELKKVTEHRHFPCPSIDPPRWAGHLPNWHGSHLGRPLQVHERGGQGDIIPY